MFALALSTPALRAQCSSALKLCDKQLPAECSVGASRSQLESLGVHRASVIIHDFAPDAERSFIWLDALSDVMPGLGVFALLGKPASPALHALTQLPHRFACVGVAISAELLPDALAAAFGDAVRALNRDHVTHTLAAEWSIDPLLTSLAKRALAMSDMHAPGHLATDRWPTLDQLLFRAGVRRATFVRHAQHAGFHPALRFLHALRVLAVASTLRTGRETITSAAALYGYRSTGTLRRHFDEIAGMTPSEARHLPLDELLRQIRLVAANVPERTNHQLQLNSEL